MAPPFLRRRPLAVALAALAAGAPGAQEIKPWHLDFANGYVGMRSLREGTLTDGGGGAGGGVSRQRQSDLRTEVYVNGQGYIYHPNLLSLDIGAGVLAQRQRFSGDSGNADLGGSQYNLSLKGAVLKDKPVRGTFYFEHLNPAQSALPGQVMTQQNQRYGGDLSVLAPVSPVPLTLRYGHTSARGRGTDRVLDDSADQLALEAARSFGPLGDTRLSWQAARQASTSGSSLLPLQTARGSSASFGIDTRLHLGAARAFDLTEVLALNQRRYESAAGAVPDQRDARLLLDLRHRTSRILQEYLAFDGSSNRQGEIDAARRVLSGGVYYRPAAGAEASVGVRDDRSVTRQVASQARGVQASANLQQPLGPGMLQASYGVLVEQRAQQAAAATVPVLGETVLLTGIELVALARGHVVPGSVTVANAARSQVFIENIDYRLDVVGTQTRIQRVVGGAILDGERVLLDYAYQSGGTFAYRQFENNLALGWSAGRRLDVSVRVLEQRPTLTEGEPTFPLNHVRSVQWGARSEVPLADTGWAAGGSIEREVRRETLLPLRRTTLDAWVQNDEPLPGFGNLRAGTRRTRIDYGLPGQNVDLVGYDVRYGGRPAPGWNFSATASRERDGGGSLPRSRLDAAFDAQWRERKLTLSISLHRTEESQGPTQRGRTLLMLNLRREL